MTEHIKIREKNKSDDIQIKEILDECFGQNSIIEQFICIGRYLL